MKSQIEVYRAKAKEYARLTILTKSLRAVDYQKLAEMYWALALGEKTFYICGRKRRLTNA